LLANLFGGAIAALHWEAHFNQYEESTMPRVEQEGREYSLPQNEMNVLMHIYRTLLHKDKPNINWVSGTYSGGICSGWDCKDWPVNCDIPAQWWDDYVYGGLQFDWDGMELPTVEVKLKEYINGGKTAVIEAGCCILSNVGNPEVHTKFKFVATLIPVASAALHEKLMEQAMQILEEKRRGRDKS
jgi:hypothetical protein